MSVTDIAVEEDRVENAETLRQLIDMVTSMHSIKWLVSKDPPSLVMTPQHNNLKLMKQTSPQNTLYPLIPPL